MIKNLALILVLSFSLNEARGEGLDAKIEQLDILAVELLGMPLATLQSLISIGERDVFVPEYSLQEGAEMNQYRRLEAEGFLFIRKAPEELMAGIPDSELMRHVLVADKWKAVVKAYDEYQYNKFKNENASSGVDAQKEAR